MPVRFRPDPFTLMLLGCLALGTVLPASGQAATLMSGVAGAAMALLFFLHGARMERRTVVAGLVHWRLQLAVLGATFVLFPLLGLTAGLLAPTLLTPALAGGVLFLCLLPSTVQSSIAFTAMAGGNAPAAICAASASNILGMVISPLLVALLFHAQGGGFDWGGVGRILLQLLGPFLLGQALQPRLGSWLGRHKALTGVVDRGSILLIVYLAFGQAAVSGLWARTPPSALLVMLAVDGMLLAAMLAITTWGSRLLGFARPDEITIMFCGSKKSLAAGVPIATVMFAGQDIGSLLLPVMLFHQLQLIVCAALARRYAQGPETAAPAGARILAPR
ncbi:bile acid:sodium symporter family protein [Methylobacterium oryzisoli]|uniref:bile acid:sodium symporter family protein n=1 Tax=Methylobacterium oryzisoli TaxID=3385502 RepID=UPI0038917ED3